MQYPQSYVWTICVCNNTCLQFVIQYKNASQEQQNFVIMKHWVSFIRISLTDLFFYEGVSIHGSRYHYQASGHDSRVFIEIILYKQCMVLSEIIKNYWQCMVFKNGCSNNKDQSNGSSLSNELVAKPDKKILGNHCFTTTKLSLASFFYFWKTAKHLQSIKCKMLLKAKQRQLNAEYCSFMTNPV